MEEENRRLSMADREELLSRASRMFLSGEESGKAYCIQRSCDLFHRGVCPQDRKILLQVFLARMEDIQK